MPVQNAIDGPLFLYFTKTFYLVGFGILLVFFAESDVPKVVLKDLLVSGIELATSRRAESRNTDHYAKVKSSV